MKKEKNVTSVVEYLLKFRDHDFLEDIYGNVEEDFFQMEDFDTYVLDINGLENIAHIMKCSVVELVIKVFESCDVVVSNTFNSYDLSVMIGFLRQAYERGICNLGFYYFFKHNLEMVCEFGDYLKSILDESILNAQFLKKNFIDMNKFVLVGENLVVNKKIKKISTNE